MIELRVEIIGLQLLRRHVYIYIVHRPGATSVASSVGSSQVDGTMFCVQRYADY